MRKPLEDSVLSESIKIFWGLFPNNYVFLTSNDRPWFSPLVTELVVELRAAYKNSLERREKIIIG